jgi:hypothetical protein
MSPRRSLRAVFAKQSFKDGGCHTARRALAARNDEILYIFKMQHPSPIVEFLLSQPNPGVGIVPFRVYAPTLNSFHNCAARLVQVSAVTELAFRNQIPQFGEISIHFFWLNVPQC